MLLGAVRDGLGLLTWEQDSFAYADSFDEAAGRYRGLRGGQQVSIDADAPGCWSSPGGAAADRGRDYDGTAARPAHGAVTT